MDRALASTWQVHGETDERLVPVRGPVAGVGQETHPVGLGAVGGPHLPPVNHILVPFLHRLGHDACSDEGGVGRKRETGAGVSVWK